MKPKSVETERERLLEFYRLSSFFGLEAQATKVLKSNEVDFKIFREFFFENYGREHQNLELRRFIHHINRLFLQQYVRMPEKKKIWLNEKIVPDEELDKFMEEIVSSRISFERLRVNLEDLMTGEYIKTVRRFNSKVFQYVNSQEFVGYYVGRLEHRKICVYQKKNFFRNSSRIYNDPSLYLRDLHSNLRYEFEQSSAMPVYLIVFKPKPFRITTPVINSELRFAA